MRAVEEVERAGTERNCVCGMPFAACLRTASRNIFKYYRLDLPDRFVSCMFYDVIVRNIFGNLINIYCESLKLYEF